VKPIHLVPAGEAVRLAELDGLAAGLARVFRVSCHVREDFLDVGFAFDAARNQYYSTAILEALMAHECGSAPAGRHRSRLVRPCPDLVFGEAQLSGDVALVSLHRLRERYYGLPARADLEQERLLKEAVHELGHTFGLRHCRDWRCVMSSSHDISRIDAKGAEFCPACRARIREAE
jgi:Predicted Zn-dependent proteases